MAVVRIFPATAIFCFTFDSPVKLYGLNPKFKNKHYFLMWVVFSTCLASKKTITRIRITPNNIISLLAIFDYCSKHLYIIDIYVIVNNRKLFMMTAVIIGIAAQAGIHEVRIGIHIGR